MAIPSNMREFSHRNKSVADNHEIPITFNDVFLNTRCKYLSVEGTLRYTPHKHSAFIEITSMKGILSSVEGWNLKKIPGGDDGKVKTNDSNFIATGKSGIDICCRDNVRWLPSASIAIKLTVYGNRRRTSRRRII